MQPVDSKPGSSGIVAAVRARLGRGSSALLWSAGQAALKLALALLLVKVLARLGGPEGLASFGQAQNILALVSVLTVLPWTSAIVRLVASENAGLGNGDRQRLRGAVVGLATASGMLVGLLLIAFATPLASRSFGADSHGAWFLRLMGLAALASSFAGALTAYATGEGRLRRVVLIQAATNLLSSVCVMSSLALGGMSAAIYGLLIAQLVVAVVTTLALLGGRAEVRSLFAAMADTAGYARVKTLLPFALAMLLPSLAGPVVEYMLRLEIVAQESWRAAGYWQALNKLSEAYLFVVTAVFGLHYLPALSSASTLVEVKTVIRQAAELLLPFTILSATGIYLCRGLIIPIALSSEFTDVENLLGPQLVGDVLRVASMILGHLLLARSSPAIYALTEFSFSAVYGALGIVMIDRWGWNGGVYAFVIAHMVYFLIALPFALRQLR